MTRQLIVVDCETTGLDPRKHWVLEVAAVNVATGDELYFVPAVPDRALEAADPKAMEVNRYFERGLDAMRIKDHGLTAWFWSQLWEWLDGNTIGGSNPGFDAAMLNKTAWWLPASPWHYRLADLSAYAAGRLGIPPTELPGLDVVCQLLGVENDCPHSALGDARAAAECFRRLSTPAPPGGVVDRPAPPTPPVDAGAGHLGPLMAGAGAGSCWCPEDPEK